MKEIEAKRVFSKEGHALLSYDEILDNMFIEIARNMRDAKAIDLTLTDDNRGIGYNISTICMPESDYNNFKQLIKRLRMRYPEDSEVFYLAKFVGLTDIVKCDNMKDKNICCVCGELATKMHDHFYVCDHHFQITGSGLKSGYIGLISKIDGRSVPMPYRKH